MFSFKYDYSEGAHPSILSALAQVNDEQTDGYGEDQFCAEAVNLIQKQMGKKCFVNFLSGGTQANLTLISHALRQHQAVISADTGHIFTNEAGAIEAQGHKVIACPATADGKLTVAAIESAVNSHNRAPHLVQPKLVYISQTTELGTVYNRKELEDISLFCREAGLYLYIDGARLAMALAVEESGLTMADYARLSDAFTAGGTKNGALFGEAMIIPNAEIARDFLYSVKQNGGLLAKGRVLGIQFMEMFREDLYVELARHANSMGVLLRDELVKLGYKTQVDSPTNIHFVLLPDKKLEVLKKNFGFLPTAKPDKEHTYVRLVTSWATTKEDVMKFVDAVAKGS